MLAEKPEMSFARPRAAAGVVIRNADSHILLVKPLYKEGWDIPGGYIEDGEVPSEACLREVREELGIDIQLGVLLVVDWAPHPAEGDKILFVFDSQPLTEKQIEGITVQPDELDSYCYVPPQLLPELVPPRLARRLHVAIHTATTTFLQHGVPIESGIQTK